MWSSNAWAMRQELAQTTGLLWMPHIQLPSEACALRTSIQCCTQDDHEGWHTTQAPVKSPDSLTPQATHTMRLPTHDGPKVEHQDTDQDASIYLPK